MKEYTLHLKICNIFGIRPVLWKQTDKRTSNISNVKIKINSYSEIFFCYNFVHESKISNSQCFKRLLCTLSTCAALVKVQKLTIEWQMQPSQTYED